jgi:hypothetical protein
MVPSGRLQGRRPRKHSQFAPFDRCETIARMRRVLPAIVVLVTVAFAVAGCGGKKTYSLTPTKSCLAKSLAKGHFRLRAPRGDFVASTAPGGAIRVVFDRRNEVTISFATNQEEAQRIVLGYQRFAGKNIGLADVLRPQKNAVLLWEAHPSDEELAAVGRCLK